MYQEWDYALEVPEDPDWWGEYYGWSEADYYDLDHPYTPKKPVNAKHREPTQEKTPTRIEFQRRVDLAREALRDFPYKSQQVKFLKERLGVHWRTAQRYLSAAMKQMIEDSQRDRAELYAHSFNLYFGIANNCTASPKYRLAAAERLDKLAGLEAPQKSEVLTLGRVEHLLAKAEQDAAEWEPPKLMIANREAHENTNGDQRDSRIG